MLLLPRIFSDVSAELYILRPVSQCMTALTKTENSKKKYENTGTIWKSKCKEVTSQIEKTFAVQLGKNPKNV